MVPLKTSFSNPLNKKKRVPIWTCIFFVGIAENGYNWDENAMGTLIFYFQMHSKEMVLLIQTTCSNT